MRLFDRLKKMIFPLTCGIMLAASTACAGDKKAPSTFPDRAPYDKALKERTEQTKGLRESGTYKPEWDSLEKHKTPEWFRDYLQEGAQVTVEIFDNRVEIYNPGGLPKGLKPEEFGTRSLCRNPLIASLLLRCNYIEKLGTGIGRIQSALKKENCPPVNVRFNTMFTQEFPRPTYVREQSSAELTDQVTLEVTPEVTPEVRRMIEIIQGDVSRVEIMASLNLKDEKHFRENYQQRAIISGLIEMTVPDKPNSRMQKYRLTDKGRKLLE